MLSAVSPPAFPCPQIRIPMPTAGHVSRCCGQMDYAVIENSRGRDRGP